MSRPTRSHNGVDDVRLGSVRDEHFRSINAVAITGENGLRFNGGHIRAVVGFRHRHGEEHVAAAYCFEIFFLLRFISGVCQRWARHICVDHDTHAESDGAGTTNFFPEDYGHFNVGILSAIFDGITQPEKTKLPHSFENGFVIATLVLPFGNFWRNLFLNETPYAVTKCIVFFCEEIVSGAHGVSFP